MFVRTLSKNQWSALLWVTLFFFSCAQAATDPLEAKFNLLILDSQKGNPYDEVRAAMLKSLASQGYIEGKNLRVTLKVNGNDIKEGERILQEERKHLYDVIFVGGTAATTAAKNVLLGDLNHRVVFASPTDPVGIGVIKDFISKPYSNFTGVCYPVPVKARLKFIKQLMPKVKTLGLIYADMPQSHSYNKWVQDLIASDPEFRHLKVIMRPVALVTGEHGDKTMADAAVRHIKELDSQVDAFLKPNDQMGTRRLFAEAVFKHASKPLIGIVKDDVMGGWGSTAVVYPSHVSIGEQTALMIKQIFEGKPVASLTPEWPKKYGFAVDLPKAKKFGVIVPVEVLQLAGENIIK